jgi:hypothetical protein
MLVIYCKMYIINDKQPSNTARHFYSIFLQFVSVLHSCHLARQKSFASTFQQTKINRRDLYELC